MVVLFRLIRDLERGDPVPPPFLSQVLVFLLTCDGNRPLTAKSVAGRTIFGDLRHFM